MRPETLARQLFWCSRLLIAKRVLLLDTRGRTSPLTRCSLLMTMREKRVERRANRHHAADTQHRDDCPSTLAELHRKLPLCTTQAVVLNIGKHVGQSIRNVMGPILAVRD